MPCCRQIRLRLADVLHRDRLAALRIVRHGDHAQGDVLRADVADELSQGGGVHVPLEIGDAVGIDALGRGQIDGRGAGELDVRPGRVEMGVVGHELARSADDREEDSLGGPALVRGDDVLECRSVRGPCLEAKEAPRAGVRLVAAHDARPIGRRSWPTVPLSVNRSISTSSAGTMKRL